MMFKNYLEKEAGAASKVFKTLWQASKKGTTNFGKFRNVWKTLPKQLRNKDLAKQLQGSIINKDSRFNSNVLANIKHQLKPLKKGGEWRTRAEERIQEYPPALQQRMKKSIMRTFRKQDIYKKLSRSKPSAKNLYESPSATADFNTRMTYPIFNETYKNNKNLPVFSDYINHRQLVRDKRLYSDAYKVKKLESFKTAPSKIPFNHGAYDDVKIDVSKADPHYIYKGFKTKRSLNDISDKVKRKDIFYTRHPEVSSHYGSFLAQVPVSKLNAKSIGTPSGKLNFTNHLMSTNPKERVAWLKKQTPSTRTRFIDNSPFYETVIHNGIDPKVFDEIKILKYDKENKQLLQLLENKGMPLKLSDVLKTVSIPRLNDLLQASKDLLRYEGKADKVSEVLNIKAKLNNDKQAQAIVSQIINSIKNKKVPIPKKNLNAFNYYVPDYKLPEHAQTQWLNNLK